MQTKTSGIILHSIKYTDTSTIITVYTRQFGRVSYMVHGVNKKKSVCPIAFLQPLTLVEMDVYHAPGKSIQRIKEISIEHPYSGIPFNPVKNSLALFLSEVLFRTLHQTEPDDNLYLFLENSFLQLDCSEAGISNFHLVFLLKLTRYLGFEPNMDEKQKSYFDLMNGVFLKEKPFHPHFLLPEISNDFKMVLMSDYSSMHDLVFSRSNRTNLLQSLVEFYRLHIPDFHGLQSLQVLQSLFD
ncbi:MAG: DNA repair protein RecO [Paludibacter sp.]|nr:DNA repair protein RecO [Paludibacter sp.]